MQKTIETKSILMLESGQKRIERKSNNIMLIIGKRKLMNTIKHIQKSFKEEGGIVNE